MRTKATALILGLLIPLLLGASYGIFSPGGALSGTWNSQSVNLGSGAFVTGNLPVGNLNSGTGAAAGTYWSGVGTWTAPAGTTVGANPTGTIGLATVNGSATTYLRSDGAPALSQAIAPSWTEQHIFGKSRTTTADFAWTISSAAPSWMIDQSGAAANNRKWYVNITSEQLRWALLNDAQNADANFMTVDRTANTVDRVAFPAETAGTNPFVVGSNGNLNTGELSHTRCTLSSCNAAGFYSPTATASTILVTNEAAAGDNVFATWITDTTTARGSVTYNRGAGLVSYNVTSSAELKDNIRAADSAGSSIDKIRVRKYEFRETGQTVPHWIIAEELKEDYPLASDGKNVDVSKLVPLMLKELQSLRLRVRDLEAQSINSRSAASDNSFNRRTKFFVHFRALRLRGMVSGNGGGALGVDESGRRCRSSRSRM